MCSRRDCNGDCGGDAVVDECGVCDGDGIPQGNCDCNGNVLDDCNVCGGLGTDIDADNICDDIDDCVGSYDDCSVCNGNNINQDDCGICFGENADKDCNGDCFGAAFVDDCDACSGGNSGHEANSDQDCHGDCFGQANIDECGICSGGNTGNITDESCSGCTDPQAENYDNTATIEDGTCVYATGPALFQFNQSTSQTPYYFESARINNIALESDDWVGAFKDSDGDGIGDICVGARKWDTSFCLNGICDILLMGVDNCDPNDNNLNCNPEDTFNYMEEGDVPLFIVYDQSENEFYDAKVFNNTTGYDFSATDFPWFNFLI